MKKKKEKLMIFRGMFILSIYFVFSFSHKFIQFFDLHQKNNFSSNQIEILKQQQEKIQVEIEKLKDIEYASNYARREYFLSKNGEKIFVFSNN